jgi:septum formation protein
VLASASPRRQELLSAAGFVFQVDPAAADESVRPGEAAADYARRVARDKARVVLARRPDAVVIAADTIVVVDGDILGKPRDRADGADMLRRLSGRSHEVLTAVVIASAHHERAHVESTRVWFATLSPAEVAWYAASDEPLDKAGAYAIQGLASRFVTRVAGSYSNVVGLPVSVVHKLLRDIGFDDLANAPWHIDRAAEQGYSEGVSQDSFRS